jgi:ankyrin repeat protein
LKGPPASVFSLESDARCRRLLRRLRKGDVPVLRGLLANDPALARAADPRQPHGGWTGLHEAAKRGQADAVRLLLEYGADANAREAGDHTYPLHWAAAHGHIDIGRRLLDAGGDVHGFGDVHDMFYGARQFCIRDLNGYELYFIQSIAE